MEAYARLFARSRFVVVVFVSLLTLVSAAGLSRIEINDVPREIFADDDEAYARLLRLYDEFGADDNDALLVYEAEDVLAPAQYAHLRAIAQRVASVEGVEEVLWAGAVPVFSGLLPRPLDAVVGEDLAGLERARAIAAAHPLIAERLISGAGSTALVIVRLSPDFIAIEQLKPPIETLRALLPELNQAPGERLRLTGIPTIRIEIFEIIRSDQTRFFLLGGVLCLLAAYLMFRNVGAVVCTTLPPMFGALWAFGLIGLLGFELDILSGILSMLVIVIALTDSVHMMIDVRLSRTKGLSALESAAAAIRHLGVPCALTSLTTAVGFASLGLASVPAIRNFGQLAAGSVVMAFLAVITVMPLLVSRMENVGFARPPRQDGKTWTIRFVRWVLSHARPLAIGGVLATVGLFALSLRLVPENRLTEALPHEESFDALMACQDAFGGVLPSYVLVEWDEGLDVASPAVMESVQAVSDFLAGEADLARPFSYLDLLDSIPGGRMAPATTLALLPSEGARRFVRPDLNRALVTTAVPDVGSDVILPLFDRILAELSRIQTDHAGVQLHLTGTDFVARTNINRMIDDLARSLAFAAFVIFGVISLEFRSIKLGAMSLIPNLFPLALVGGTLWLFGMPLQMATAVLFTVLLGLAVDDTIHFLSRYRRERNEARAQGLSLEGTLESSYLAVGRAIVVTTVLLTVAFGVVAFSEIPTNKAFAALSCLGLFGALIGDLVFFPALLRLRGE